MYATADHPRPDESSTLAELSPPFIKWWCIISAGTSCIHWLKAAAAALMGQCHGWIVWG